VQALLVSSWYRNAFRSAGMICLFGTADIQQQQQTGSRGGVGLKLIDEGVEVCRHDLFVCDSRHTAANNRQH
jgi:hypothetical protein